ncbi:MAG TPA: ANTAR domain-containing protein [Mycobacterium sp.]|nr:ANTAR domain-containing protein [Mycobacterium sp.]
MRGLAAKPDADATLTAITAAVVAAVPNAACASISRVVSGDRMVAHASTQAIAHELEQLQAGLQHGPSIEALRRLRTVNVPDMASDGRWPDFASAALQLGVGSMLAMRLFAAEKTLGVLNLYSTVPHGFSAQDQTIADVFAAHAATALHAASERQGLNQAIVSRDVIGQAKGILMVRHRTTAVRAFDMLVAASQQTNLKLVDVAHWLIAENEHSAQRRSTAIGPAGDVSGVRLRPPATIAGISGEIDAGNVGDVRRYVAGLISIGRMLVLDLSEVQFLSVAGLRLLQSIDEQCVKAELDWALVSSDAVDMMLRVAGHHHELPTSRSVTAALQRLTRSMPAHCSPPPVTPAGH